MSVQLDSAFNYNDLNGLETLKSSARKDDPEALKVVSQQFESMFLSLIMKSMRDATDVMASDLESSYQTKFYRDMYDQQLSLSVSKEGGFGLADILYEQLSESLDGGSDDLSSIQVESLENSNRPVLPANPGYSATLDANDENTDETIPAAESVADPEQVKITLPIDEDELLSFSSPAEFIQTLMPAAEQAAAQLGVDPKVILAQAALETGWGAAMIEDEEGISSNNFFGIKADERWQGDAVETLTTEVFDGKAMTVTAPFRAYDDPEASFQDYVDFLSSSDRYQTALSVADDSEQYVNELQDAGYATDPDYAEKILRIASSQWFTSV